MWAVWGVRALGRFDALLLGSLLVPAMANGHIALVGCGAALPAGRLLENVHGQRPTPHSNGSVQTFFLMFISWKGYFVSLLAANYIWSRASF